MITDIVLLFGFGLVVFLVFWLTLALTGKITAAFWSPVIVAGTALLIRAICAGQQLVLALETPSRPLWRLHSASPLEGEIHVETSAPLRADFARLCSFAWP